MIYFHYYAGVFLSHQILSICSHLTVLLKRIYMYSYICNSIYKDSYILHDQQMEMLMAVSQKDIQNAIHN